MKDEKRGHIEPLSLGGVVRAALRPIIVVQKDPTQFSIVTKWGSVTLRDIDAQLILRGWTHGHAGGVRIGRLDLTWTRGARRPAAEYRVGAAVMRPVPEPIAAE